MYQIINKRTGEVVGTRKLYRAARKLVDKLDNEYGAYVHFTRYIAPFQN